MNPQFIIIGILLVIFILVICYISISNKLNRSVIKIDEALSGIDVALTKRYDVLTKMIEVVKGYTKHEKETLFEVINLRKESSIKEKNDANLAMDENIKKINVVAENYPDLKASANWEALQTGVIEAEEHLQASRRAYNAAATQYNNYHVTFPNSLIANRIKPEKREYFEAEASKKEDVKID